MTVSAGLTLVSVSRTFLVREGAERAQRLNQGAFFTSARQDKLHNSRYLDHSPPITTLELLKIIITLTADPEAGSANEPATLSVFTISWAPAERATLAFGAF